MVERTETPVVHTDSGGEKVEKSLSTVDLSDDTSDIGDIEIAPTTSATRVAQDIEMAELANLDGTDESAGRLDGAHPQHAEFDAIKSQVLDRFIPAS